MSGDRVELETNLRRLGLLALCTIVACSGAKPGASTSASTASAASTARASSAGVSSSSSSSGAGATSGSTASPSSNAESSTGASATASSGSSGLGTMGTSLGSSASGISSSSSTSASTSSASSSTASSGSASSAGPSGANSSSGSSGGSTTGGGGDGGILYTPYSCGDGGSPYDRTESFTAPNGQTVVITVCGPRPAVRTLRVSVPDGGSAVAALYAASRSAVDGGVPTEIDLDTGVYDVSGIDAGWYIPGATDLLIDGHGSTLVFHGPVTGLELNQAQRVLIRHIKVDWGERLAIGGAVVQKSAACDGGTAFQADPAYLTDSGAPLPLYVVSEFDPHSDAGPRWPLVPFQQTHWVLNPNQKPTYAGRGLYCMSQPQRLAQVDSGTPAIGLARSYGGNAVFVFDSSNVALEDATVYASPAEAFTFMGGGAGFRMSQCRDIRNTSDPLRLISSDADGVNFRETLGSVILEDSEFADQGDDGVSLVGQFFAVDPTSTNGSLVLSPSTATLVQPGDDLWVENSATFAPVGHAEVTSVTELLDGGARVGAIVALADGGIPLSGAGPFADGGLIAVVPLRSSPNFLVQNVYVHGNDQRGILIHSWNGLVQDSTFQDDLGAIFMAQDNVFLEGPGAQNVTLQSCQFKRCDFMANLPTEWSCQAGLGSAPPAPLSVMTMTYDTAFPPNLPNADLVLQDNVIDGAPGPAIAIADATQVWVDGNTILDANQEPPAASCGLYAPLPQGSMIALESTDVVFSGNRRDGGTTLGLALDSTCIGCDGGSGY